MASTTKAPSSRAVARGNRREATEVGRKYFEALGEFLFRFKARWKCEPSLEEMWMMVMQAKEYSASSLFYDEPDADQLFVQTKAAGLSNREYLHILNVDNLTRVDHILANNPDDVRCWEANMNLALNSRWRC